MSIAATIDTAWHPLVSGLPPAWASEWGQDQYGVFVAFSLGEVTQRLRWIPPGRFRMGSPEDEPERYVDEGLQQTITLASGYWLFDTVCTQALWAAVMGNNPSRFKSPDRPVERVSWQQAQDFMQRLNARITGLNLVLPTEAQWEYACRSGTDTALYTGPIDILGAHNAPALDPIAWYGGNSGQGFELDDGEESSDWPEKQYPHTQAGTRPVALKEPNPWGLYDMLGNVWEWTGDAWHGSHEGADPDGRPREGAAGAARVIRGGSWDDGARSCRSAARYRSVPDLRYDGLGFRCARVQA